MPNQNDNTTARSARVMGLSPIPDTFENVLTDGSGALLVKAIGTISASIGGSITANITNTVNVFNAAELNKTSVQGVIGIGTAAIQAIVSSAPLAERKFLYVENQSSQSIYWGNSSVTTLNGGTILHGEYATWAIGSSSNIYIIQAVGSGTIRVIEMS